jgi:hypothetical protein
MLVQQVGFWPSCLTHSLRLTYFKHHVQAQVGGTREIRRWTRNVYYYYYYYYILFSFEHGALYYLHSFILTIISFFIYYKWHGNNFEL